MRHIHCYLCTEGSRAQQMICCECGDALTPWHPDIQWKYIDGEMKQ